MYAPAINSLPKTHALANSAFSQALTGISDPNERGSTWSFLGGLLLPAIGSMVGAMMTGGTAAPIGAMIGSNLAASLGGAWNKTPSRRYRQGLTAGSALGFLGTPLYGYMEQNYPAFWGKQ